MCLDAARTRNWDVTGIFKDEGVSSETLERPELQKLIAAINDREIDRLIVYGIDRLTRRLTHLQILLELFEANAVELVVVNDPSYSDTPVSRLMTNIVAAASEFQQDLTRERTADMRAALKRQGKRVAGRVPFGYLSDPETKKLVVHPSQAMVVREFFARAARGVRPSVLAKFANEQNWLDQNGETGTWTPRRIVKLLKNATYTGQIRSRDGWLPGEHEPIANSDLFDAVQAHLSSRNTRKAKTKERKPAKNPYRVNLLGRLFCGQCNRPMTTSVSHKGTIRYLSYRCRSSAGGKPPCPKVGIGQHRLERFVCDALADPDDAEFGLSASFQRQWRELPESKQQRHLPDVIAKVVFDYASGEVAIMAQENVEEFFDAPLENVDQKMPDSTREGHNLEVK
tara:strand:- start:106963 stop:108156 length:1194 start_codon:yes stop_codon:yes gene_type:complete